MAKSEDIQNIKGTVKFVQHHLPPFEAGEYKISISHALSASKGDLPGDTDVAEYSFVVQGDRFTLSPENINKVFPPNKMQGEYDSVLPHVVLTRRTLPWERTPLTSGIVELDNSLKDVPTWLAVLIFQDDPVAPAPPRTKITLQSLYDLPTTNTISQFTPGKSGGESLDNILEYGQNPTDECWVIDVSVPLFNQIAPSLEDLKWTAHSRKISFEDDGSDESDYAMVIANCLPAQDSHAVAHLVSLEGMGNHLPNDDGSDNTGLGIDGTVSLVSLYSWEFTDVPDTITFAHLLENLNKKLVDSNPFSESALLRLSVEGITDPTAQNALDRGYTAMPHHLRTGNQTLSWYRGPLAPYQVGKTLGLPISNADDVTFYDPGIGMFDVSYAAAWQLGRLLALADKPFAVQLYYWKREIVREALRRIALGALEE